MKLVKTLSLIIITALLFIPQMTFVRAASTPSYVGIEENDVLTYTIIIDKDPYESYLEDYGYSDTTIENITDRMFDGPWDEDVNGWRYVILEIKDEKEYTVLGDDYDGVPYIYNWYIRETGGDWEEEESSENGDLLKYDKDFYVYRTSEMRGLYYLIAANNVNWKRVVSGLNEEYDDYWDGEDQKAEASVETSLYYFTQREEGLNVIWNPDENVYEDFKSTSRYNDDGVLMYYEWSYDGRPILNYILQGNFFHYYGWVIILASIAGVVIVVLIVTLVVLPRKKKGKKEKIAPTPIEKTPETVAPAAPAAPIGPPQKQFCPNCGNPISPDAAFCPECGSRMED